MSAASKRRTAQMAAELGGHLSANAGRYFPELAGQPARVRLSRVDPRTSGAHFRFTVSGEGEPRRVLVKVRSPLPAGAEEVGSHDPAALAALEYRALVAIHDRFGRLDASRFGTVRAFETLPEHRAVVMELVSLPSLRDLYVRSSYLRSERGAERLEEAFRNSGAWLAHYHGAPRIAGAVERRPCRADYLRFVERLTESLGEAVGDRGFFSRIAAAVTAMADAFLPDSLPLGPGHGDFALRNLLAGPGGRVTVIDTLGAWQAPIYEDIGCFLHSLRCNRVRVLTRGAAIPAERLAAYERAFLSGYFGQGAVPRAAVRLYEAQAALEKWSSLVAFAARAPGWGSYLARSARLGLMTRFFRETLGTLLLAPSPADDPAGAEPVVGPWRYNPGEVPR